MILLFDSKLNYEWPKPKIAFRCLNGWSAVLIFSIWINRDKPSSRQSYKSEFDDGNALQNNKIGNPMESFCSDYFVSFYNGWEIKNQTIVHNCFVNELIFHFHWDCFLPTEIFSPLWPQVDFSKALCACSILRPANSFLYLK